MHRNKAEMKDTRKLQLDLLRDMLIFSCNKCTAVFLCRFSSLPCFGMIDSSLRLSNCYGQLLLRVLDSLQEHTNIPPSPHPLPKILSPDANTCNKVKSQLSLEFMFTCATFDTCKHNLTLMKQKARFSFNLMLTTN